jgi:hypothetical protein
MDVEINVYKEKYIYYLKNGGAFIKVNVFGYLRCFVYTVIKLQCSGMQVSFIFHVHKMKLHYKRLYSWM